MLKKLIVSIFENKIDWDFIRNVDLIVVDNDKEKTAEPVIKSLLDEYPDSFSLGYVNYPEKGLANVRNQILTSALALNADFIASVDDDEYVSQNWLMQLTKCIVENSGDIALGPVLPDFENTDVSVSIADWFYRPDFENYQKLEDSHKTGNQMIRADFLIQHNIRFDKRFNSTGAEDTFFGIQAVKKGAAIYWAKHAIVFETIPRTRSTFEWLLRRTYRGAITYTYILFLEKKYLLIFKKFLVSIFNLLLGVFGMVLMPFDFKYKYYGPMKLAESAGGFAGMLNFKYNEYDKER